MTLICAECDGARTVEVAYGYDGDVELEDCPGCRGTGIVPCSFCPGDAVEILADGAACELCVTELADQPIDAAPAAMGTR